MEELRIELSNVNVYRLGEDGTWGNKLGDWIIADPWEKLVAKYETGTTYAFDLYVCHGRSRYPNVITSADIATVNTLMNANAGATRDAHARLTKAIVNVEPLLAEIPVDASLIDGVFLENAVEILDQLIVESEKGTRLAIASKLVHMKRPFLVPMFDGVVQNCLNTEQTRPALERFIQLLQNNLTTLEALAGRVAIRFGRV